MNTKGSVWVSAFVVLVMAVVVAAVFFPIFARTGCRGCRESTCQSNLHEVGIALAMYMEDTGHRLPSSYLINRSAKWNKQDFLKFATMIGSCSPAEGSKRETYREIIYDYVKNKDIFFCAADGANRRDPNAPCSYWWKLAIDKAWYGEGCKKPCRKEDDYGYIADQVLFYEHRSFHTEDILGLTDRTMINVAFMDSHVKAVILQNTTSGDPLNCAANSNGEPMYYNTNGETGKSIPDPNTPAAYVDPAVYCDAFTYWQTGRPAHRGLVAEVKSYAWVGIVVLALIVAGILIRRRVRLARGVGEA